MKTKKELLRRAAAFVSALTFLSSCNINAVCTVAEETTAASTGSSAEAEEEFVLKIGIEGVVADKGREQDILNRFKDSEAVSKLTQADSVSVNNNEGIITLDIKYKCVPESNDEIRNSIIAQIADYSDEYTLGEELYTVSFDASTRKIKTDEFFRIDDQSRCLDEISGKYNGYRPFNGSYYIKRGAYVKPSDFKVKAGYNAHYPEENQFIPVEKKIVVEDCNNGQSARAGFYGSDGQFCTLVEIERTTLKVIFDTNDVMLKQLDTNKSQIGSDNTLTIPWLDIDNTDITVYTPASGNIVKFVVRDMNGEDNSAYYDVQPDSNGTPIKLKELIKSQFTADGKAEFTANAEYTVSITGIHKTNKAWRVMEDIPAEKIDVPLGEGEIFNIPYLIQSNNKVWYLSKCVYKYENLTEPQPDEKTFAELYNEKLKSGKRYADLPYKKWSNTDSQDHKLKMADDETLFSMYYKAAADYDDAVTNDFIKQITDSVKSKNIHFGKRDPFTLDLEYSERYRIVLPESYKEKTFIYTDERGKTFTCKVRTIEDEDEGTERYTLSLPTTSEDDPEGYRPEFFKFMAMVDENNEPCDMTPFVIYFDNHAPKFTYNNDYYNDNNGWSKVNKYSFDLLPEDPVDDMSGLPYDMADIAESISNNDDLDSISLIMVGEVPLNKPDGGWDSVETVSNEKAAASDGTGGYRVTAFPKKDQDGKLYFTVNVSIIGKDNGLEKILPVVLYDNTGKESNKEQLSVKIDTGKPKAEKITAEKLRKNIVLNSKLTISAEVTDKYGTSPCSGIEKAVYRFEKVLNPDMYTNTFKKEFIGEEDIKNKKAVFDFGRQNLKGYIVVELTDKAGNTEVYYYTGKNAGNLTKDLEEAEELIVDNSAPPIPVISDEDNDHADADIDGNCWFKDYHPIKFSAKDEKELNSGLATIGFVICGNEFKKSLSQLGFGTDDAGIAAAEKSLEKGEFYLDFVADTTDNTGFIPHLKNKNKDTVDIVLSESPISLRDNGMLDIGIYCIDNAGNRCIRNGTEDTMSSLEYFVDNNKPAVSDTFNRSASENEDSVRIKSYGTYANRKISIDVSVADDVRKLLPESNEEGNVKIPSSGLAEAVLTYTYGDDQKYTAKTDIFENSRAVFSIPANEIPDNTVLSGTLSLSVTDKVGNSSGEILLTSPKKNRKLVIENKAPRLTETPEIKGENEFIKNAGKPDEQRWYSGDVEITFSADDDESGIAAVKITADEGKFSCEKPFDNTYDNEQKEDTFTLKTDHDTDGAFTASVNAEDNAGNTAHSEYKVFKDVNAPYVSGFRFDQEVRKYDDDVVDPEKKDKYSHFADKTIPMTVRINDDKGSSSGIREVYIHLKSVDGLETGETFGPDKMRVIEGEKACEVTYDIPEGFKGDITAWAVDNVGNTSDKRSPNGFISENYNTHETHVGIKAELPHTDRKDAEGLDLYKEDVKARLEVSDNFSGIQQIKWMTSDMDDWQTIDIDMDGKIIGENYGWKISDNSTDRNISVKAQCDVTVTKDANDDVIMLQVKDNTGHVTKYEKHFSIDKKVPVIEVTGIEKHDGVTYYNSHKSAHITISERNYDIPKVNGQSDASFNEDKNSPAGTDQFKHIKDMPFDKDGRYELNISNTDMAGNNAEEYRSGVFVIDTTSPKAYINVRRTDGTEVKTGDNAFVETDASASVTVDEVNFSPDSFTITINGSVYTPSVWSGGNSHTANIPSSYFAADGTYTITVSGKDLAGNTLRSVSASFTVDKKKPEINISGISNANKGEVTPVVKITDDNLDAQDVKVYKNGELLNVKYEDDGDVAKYDVNNKGNYIVGRWSSDNVEAGVRKKMVFDNFPEEESYDGNYKIEVDTADKAENKESDSMEFSVNRFGSVFTVENAESINGRYLSKAPTVVIKEKNVDKHKSDSDIIIIIDKGSNTVKLTSEFYTVSEPVELEDGSGYEYTYTILPENFSQDLNYNISIQSVDEAGNKNVSSSRGAEISFNVDTHSPNFKCDDLVDRAEFKESERVFKLNVNEKLAHIKVTTSQDEVLLEKHEEDDDNSYTFRMPASNSLRDLTIEMIDLAGNRTTKTYKDLLITENVALFVMHKTWAKIVGIAAAAGVGAIAAAYIIRKRWRGY